MRSRVPTMRNPAAWCRARLAVFSGKMPDWMVQIPAASVEAISASRSRRPMPRPRVGGVDVDGVLDHPGVDAAAGYGRGGHPPGDLACGVIATNRWAGSRAAVKAAQSGARVSKVALPSSIPAW